MRHVCSGNTHGIPVLFVFAVRAMFAMMQEAESCLPFGVCLLGQSYGWVPPTLRPWMALRFPWFRHFTNSELEDVHAKEVRMQVRSP